MFDQIKNSMNSKNWDLMGSDIRALQELIDKLEAEKKKEDEQKSKNTIVNDQINDSINNIIENTVE